MLTLEPFSEDQGRSAVHPARGSRQSSFLAPCGFTHPLTRTHVRLLGPCFKTGRMGCPQAGAGEHAGISPRRPVLPTTIDATASPRAYRQLGLWPAHQSAPVHRPESIGGPGPYRRSTSDGTHRRPPFRFPPDNFKHSLTLFSKSFSSFPRGTAPRGATGSGHDGALTLSGAPFQGTWARSAAEDASQTTIRTARPSDFQAGLIPVRSPLLRESLDAMVGGDAMRDAQAGVPSAGWLWAQLAFKNSMVHVHGSFCFAGFDNDPSAGSPTETLLRLLLPLNDKVQWNSRDVAGGEPPTSPRS
ncbi:hypothetical protein L1887_44360 [Cichorium endivia]|nr:hypothetical protein L1887_44360 [Cichorium endivia]